MFFKRKITETQKKETFNIGKQSQAADGMDIAVIGMSARFPDAADYNQFWHNLEETKACIREIPKERWEWKKYYKIQGKIRDRTVSRWGGFIDHADTFDFRFFGISKREADAMDPQQRILLEEAWSCLEDANIPPSNVAGRKVGVFVAGCNVDFRDLIERNHEPVIPHYATGAASSILANRISYIFDFKGPSVQLDTACSGSLAAIHYGAEAILNGECEMVLVGASNVMLSPDNYVRLSKMYMLSPTGSVKTFDKDADGYVRGEGAGFVLLKSRKKAIEDKNRIYAVIKGTAITHGGCTASITYPSAEAQADAIVAAVKRAGVPAESINYIELHGTGTPKGDPIEFQGLVKAFKTLSSETGGSANVPYCGLGSVKTNVGHLENTAGLAGLVKVLMSLQHGRLPAMANFKEMNPDIHMEGTPFYLVTKSRDWTENGKWPRRAGISSFGFGGTDCHMVIEEAPALRRTVPEKENHYRLIAFSAKNREALLKKAEQLDEYLKDRDDEISIGDISYTLLCGRDHFSQRAAFIADSLPQVRQCLKNIDRYVGSAKESQSAYSEQTAEFIRMAVQFPGDRHSVAYKDRLKQLERCYRQGADADWEPLFDTGCRKIHLPAYPFARIKCWMPDGNGPVEGVEAIDCENSEGANDEYALLTFEEKWEPAGLAAGKPNKPGAYMILLPENYPAAEVPSDLFGDNRVFYLESGGAFKRISDSRYVINTDRGDDYATAFESIRLTGTDIAAVFDFLPLGDERYRRDAFYLTYILQACYSAGIKNTDVLVAGGYSSEAERCNIEALIGYERSIGMIMPGIRIKTIIGEIGGFTVSRWAKLLCAELNENDQGSVLYKNGVRNKLVIKEKTLNDQHTSIIKHGGTYFITGGAGGLGRLFASYLLKKYHANVVLTGRSGGDTQEDKIKPLQNMGGEVLYIKADVSSEREMTYAVTSAVDAFGKIDGVIHAAGIDTTETIIHKTKEGFLKTTAPKIEGTIVLDKVFQAARPDFICFFSSSSSIIGDFGGCDYSVGNRFQQAFAAYKSRVSQDRNTKFIAINWPLWKNGGMALKDAEVTNMYLKSSGQTYLLDSEGTEIFERLLLQDMCQCLVIPGEKDRVLKFLGITATAGTAENKDVNREKEKPDVALAAQTGNSNTAEKTINTQSKVAVDGLLLDDLKKLSSQILRISKDELHGDTNFADVGYDSVNLGDFAESLSAAFRLDITPDVFFGYPTFDRMKDYIMKKYRAVIEEHYKTDSIREKSPTKDEPVTKQNREATLTQTGSETDDDPIAIVGISGKFPGADNTDGLWNILKNGGEVLKDIPESRLKFAEEDKVSSTGHPWKMGMLRAPAEFDPLFFEISPGEAETMDPRQRILLEEEWKALEDAGYGEENFQNESIGIFVGAEDGDYRLITADNTRFTSNHNGIMAARLAYMLNFNGPNMAINTACSSGLTAFHQACLSLRCDDCDAAIAAGVSLILRPENYMDMAKAGMLSANSTCYAFDKRADGMVPAEAVAVVVLKKLSRALKDKNRVYAIVAGSGTNYDGKTNGITAPSGSAQERLYSSVYRKNKIDPQNISYIVAHGTGTKLGDPIEVHALSEAFRRFTDKRGYCAITSTKPNIGHTLAASGIVSLISLVLAFENETIPASIHCEQVNEYIHWEDSPLYINRENRAWKDEPGKKRMGAVSAFGMSGTNVHVVLESYTKNNSRTEKLPYYLLAISAKTKPALFRKLHDMADYFQADPETDMASVSYTLIAGRCHFQHRCAVIVKDSRDAAEALEKAVNGQSLKNVSFNEVDRDFYEQDTIADFMNSCTDNLDSKCGSENDFFSNMCILADFYCRGYRINGKKLFKNLDICTIRLPFYPFENSEYWVDDEHTRKNSAQAKANPPAVEAALEKILVPSFKQVNIGLNDSLATGKIVLVCGNPQIERTYAESGCNIQLLSCRPEDDMETLAKKIKSAGRFDRLIWAAPVEGCAIPGKYDAVSLLEDTVYYLFRTVKALLKLGYRDRDFDFCVVTELGQDAVQGDLPDPCQAGTACFASVLAKEISNWNVRIFDIESGESCPVKDILYCDNKANGGILAYRDGNWYGEYEACHSSSGGNAKSGATYKSSGVYVVVGGAGDVGSIWSEYMIRKYDARIIWLGRRSLNDEIKDKIRKAGSFGTAPEYYSVDVTDRESLQRIYKRIVGRFGNINGVVYSAVNAFDRGISTMSEEEFRNVLKIKTVGTVNTELVFGSGRLDFILYFSSMSALERPSGQCGYAAGCGFTDAYAKCMNTKGAHRSKTMDWGFWGNLGAGRSMPESIKVRIALTGMRPLNPEKAMAAAEVLINDDVVRLGYINTVCENTEQVAGAAQIETSVCDDSKIENFCLETVSNLIGGVLKIPSGKFNKFERLEKYGIDSITVTQLIHEIKKVFPTAESTIFYEYATTDALAQYFVKNHADEVKARFYSVAASENKNVEKAAEHRGNTRVAGECHTIPEKIKRNNAESEDAVAVIGMSGRFPMAQNVEEFWENLRTGCDCITDVPASRWALDGFYIPDIEEAVKKKKSYLKSGGFIGGFSEFDPQFFKISPREAMAMDPQERTLLEECWRTLEDGGYTPEKIERRCNGNVGVFVGVTRTGFELYNPDLWRKGKTQILSTSFSSMANRISYTFNFHGPCFSIDTMCSSSLTALHEACEHIKRGECEMAMVGSANIYTHPATYRSFCEKRMVSPSGKCHTFGEDADGFVPGEAVCAVLLKPLSKALKDNDSVYGIIRSTSINHGGRTNGFTVPNPAAQCDLIRTALDRAGVNARTVSYIEAHGTGTKLGDPIEIAGLTKAFRSDTQEKQYCSIGSLKTNVGHSEAAAGLSGVIKILLQMKNGLLVPSLNSAVTNPLIDFENSPFYIQHQLSEWNRPVVNVTGEQKEYPRIAGISAFGAGGSNAHAVIEEFRSVQRTV